MAPSPATESVSAAEVARIRAIARTIPSHEKIMCGDTTHECTQISKELQEALAKNGIETLFVGAESEGGPLRHNYLIAKLDGKPVIIDPTISQFIPSEKNVFVGSRADAMKLAAKQHNSGVNWNEVWPEHPVAPHRTGVPLTREETEAFNAKWGGTGAVLKDYTQEIAAYNRRLAASGRQAADHADAATVPVHDPAMSVETSGVTYGAKRTAIGLTKGEFFAGEHMGALVLAGTFALNASIQLYHSAHVAVDQARAGHTDASVKTLKAAPGVAGESMVDMVKGIVGYDEFAKRKDPVAGVAAIADNVVPIASFSVNEQRDADMRAAVPAGDVNKLIEMLPSGGLQHASHNQLLDSMIRLKEKIMDPGTQDIERHQSQIALDYDARMYIVDASRAAFAKSGQPQTQAAQDHFSHDYIARGSHDAFAFAENVMKANQPPAGQAPADAHADPVMAKFTAEAATLRRYESDLQALETATNLHRPVDPKVLAELQAMPEQITRMTSDFRNEDKALQSQLAKNPQLAREVDEVSRDIWGVQQHLNHTQRDFGGAPAFEQTLAKLEAREHQGEPLMAKTPAQQPGPRQRS